MNSKRKASAAGFDDDASMEILVRLPIKCVIRFQIVCRTWLSLISSDHFRREHTLRHHNPPPGHIFTTQERLSLFYFNTATKLTKIIPLSFNIPGNCQIVSCCNGLVVLRRGTDFQVYNPMTRQSRKIILPLTHTYTYLCKLHLVFDPSKSPHYKILYIRPEHKLTSAHKILYLRPGHKLTSARFTTTYTIEVFSSESGTWKAWMDPIPVSSKDLEFTHSIYCNNNIYIYGKRNACVYCIDINKNVLRSLEIPRVGMQIRYNFESIQEWNGYLYYAALYSDDSAGLWVKSDDDKWSLKYHHKISLPGSFTPIESIRLIAQTSTLLFLVYPKRIMTYNFLDKSCNEFRDLDILRIPILAGSMHLFHQTLAPV